MSSSGASVTKIVRFVADEIFAEGELANSNITGSNDKSQLDPEKVDAITALAISLYPSQTKGAIRAAINQKCVDKRRGKTPKQEKHRPTGLSELSTSITLKSMIKM